MLNQQLSLFRFVTFLLLRVQVLLIYHNRLCNFKLRQTYFATDVSVFPIVVLISSTIWIEDVKHIELSFVEHKNVAGAFESDKFIFASSVNKIMLVDTNIK